MKKQILSIVLIVVALTLTPYKVLAAGGHAFNLTINSVSPATAQTNSIVTVSIHTWLYQCTATPFGDERHFMTTDSSYCSSYPPGTLDGPVAAGTGEKIQMDISGDGNTVLTAPLTVDSSGNATFQFKSSVAGQKTISFSQYMEGAIMVMGGNWDTKTITITAPATTKPTATNKAPDAATATTNPTKPTTETSGNQNETTKTAPTAPVLASVTVGTTKFTPEKIATSQFKTSEAKVFSGTTIPNGLVHLYFHSDPFEDTVTADGQGNWTYNLKKDIGTGEHNLQIAVTDPSTNLTSQKSSAQKFTITTGNTGAISPKNNPTILLYTLAGVFIVVALALAVGFLIRKRSKHESNSLNLKL